MKKLFFLSIIALAMGFTACDDLETQHGIPQVNPGQELFNAANLNVAATPEAQGVVNLNSYTTDALVPVATVTVGEGWPEGYGFGAVAHVDGKGNIPCTVEGNTVSVDAAQLYEVVYNQITKNPAQLGVKLSFDMYAVKGTQSVRIGENENTTYGDFAVQLVPFEPDHIIAPEYYIAFSLDGENWDKNDALKLNHSAVNQYDDPVFSLAYDFPEDIVGQFWKIVASTELNNIAASGYGTSEEEFDKESGSLLAADYTPGMFFLSGQSLLTINMDRLTFDFKIAIPNFWTPGGSNSWSFPRPTLTTEDYINYYGYAYLSGEFKFSPVAAWNGDFGSADGVTYEEKDGCYIGSGVAEGSQNIKVPAEGCYFIKLDYPTRALEMYQVKVIGLIGGFNGWGATAALTPNADYSVWTGTMALTAGEFKFRGNNNWDINLGGSLDHLVPNGDNLKIDADGTYEVTLDLSKFPYSATLVKK